MKKKINENLRSVTVKREEMYYMNKKKYVYGHSESKK